MKVYGPKGQVYEGEPVDCRELMQVGGYTKEPQSVEDVAVESGAEQKSPVPVEAIGKSADQTKGKSAKVGK